MAAARLLGPTVDGHTTTTTRSGGTGSRTAWTAHTRRGGAMVALRPAVDRHTRRSARSGASNPARQAQRMATDRRGEKPPCSAPFSASHLGDGGTSLLSPRQRCVSADLSAAASPALRRQPSATTSAPPRPHAVGSRGKGEDRGKGKRN